MSRGAIGPRILTFALVLAVAALPRPAAAEQLTCAQDKATEGLFCFAPSEIRERDGIRYAGLYMGGPNGVHATAFQVAANCATGVLHLKDREGVSFAGSSYGEGTRQSRDLHRLVCAAPLKQPKGAKR